MTRRCTERISLSSGPKTTKSLDGRLVGPPVQIRRVSENPRIQDPIGEFHMRLGTGWTETRDSGDGTVGVKLVLYLSTPRLKEHLF